MAKERRAWQASNKLITNLTAAQAQFFQLVRKIGAAFTTLKINPLAI